jgi:hypothetical protein
MLIIQDIKDAVGLIQLSFCISVLIFIDSAVAPD